MQRLELTNAERDAGEVPDEKKRAAVDAIWQDGAVVVENAIDPAITDHVYDGMMRDLDWIERHFGKPDRSKGFSHGFAPPKRRSHIYREIHYHPFAIAVNEALLGAPKGIHFATYHANWSFPLPPEERTAEARHTPDAEKKGRQVVHGDMGPLFPSMSEPEPPINIIVQVLLTDFTEENGATEIWPGTHMLRPTLTDAKDKDEKQRMLEKRRGERPPERMEAPRASLVLRDNRMWHAGMPNFSDEKRIMITMNHLPVWMRATKERAQPGRTPPGTIAYEPDAADLFGHEVLEHHTAFVEGADRNRLFEYLEQRAPELLR